MKSKTTFIIAGILTLFIFALGIFFWKREQNRQWRWAKIPMPERFARVPSDWDVTTLAQALEKNKKIRDAGTFEEAATRAKLKTVPSGGN